MSSFVWGLAAVLLLLSAPLSADDWPQWRGPTRDSISREKGLLTRWDSPPPLAWRGAGLGTGYASVVVSRGRVITIGKHGDDVFAVALSESNGEPIWRRAIGHTKRIPCATPTIDGDRVFVLDPDGNLSCLDFESGTEIWHRAFLKDFGGVMMSGRGYGESPLIDGELLICTPGGPNALLVALDKETGAVRWKTTAGELGSAGRNGAGFSSPVKTVAAGRPHYVQLVGRGLVGVDAANGKLLWHYNHIANGTANIPTPVVQGDYVFAANGYHAGCVLLQLKATPDGVAAREVYRHAGNKFQNHHGGVLFYDGCIFGGHGSNNGLPTCLELETGKIRWKRRGPGVGSAAVTFADSRLYFRYQDGLVALLDASTRRYRLLGSFRIPGAGGDSWSHPVVANGRLYLREQHHLYVHDLTPKATLTPRKGGSANDRTAAADPLVTPPLSPALPGELAVKLRQLGVTATQISGSKSQAVDLQSRFLSYAIPGFQASAAAETRRSAVMLTLLEKHLDDAGAVSKDLRRLIDQIGRPLVLDLSGTTAGPRTLADAASIESLCGLRLRLCRAIDDAALQPLADARQLRMLDLTGTAVSDRGLPQLTAWPALVALNLEICDGITNDAGSHLAQLSRLQALIVKKTGFEPRRIDDQGFRQLCGLSQLELLDLYGNKVTGKGLVHIAALKKLRQLDLSLLAVQDDAVKYLRPLPALQHLSLLYSVGFAGPILTDKCLAPLSELGQLVSLDLTGARISDAELRQLSRLKTLRQLRLSRTPITLSAVELLQTQLPACRIQR